MLGSYLSNYTSGHADARKMQEMYNNPSKYTYDEFKKQLGKAKYAPNPRDYSDTYARSYRFGDDERKAEQKYNTDYAKYLGIRNSLLLDFKGRAAAPAPAAPKPKAAPAPKPAPVATDNTYRKESEALLKTIDALTKEISKPQPAPKPPPPPTTIFGSSTSLSPSNLQIAPAAGINKMGGTSSFKRRTTSPSTAKVRTIQSLNI